jgi:tetratricopeptide (TPR) repeat protein
VQAGPQKVADRYSYLSCLPWALLVGAAVYRLWVSRRVPRPVLVVAVTAWIVLLALLASDQTRVWRDSLSLWDRVVELDPRNYFALTNRGMARQVTKGDTAGALEDYDVALAVNPEYPIAYNNRGVIRVAQGDVQGGIADYTAALRLRPEYASAYANRAAARERLGDTAGALQDYSDAIRYDADLLKAYYGRGNVRAALGDLRGALADYDAALRINPGLIEALNNRANARRVLGDDRGAVADLERALALTEPGTAAHDTIARNLDMLRAGLRP